MTPEENRVRVKVYREANKDLEKVRHGVYRKANKDAIRVRQAKYYAANKARIRADQKIHSLKTRAQTASRARERRRTNPNCKLKENLSSRIRIAVKHGTKSARTLGLLGCSIEFLREHLEKQFVPGMTWENYGSIWHIDHILPCAEFHLQHSEEQEICFNWSNLQPLFAKDNILKGDKII